MKNAVLSTMLMFAVVAPVVAAELSSACAAKRTGIETQIAQAESHGRSREVAGLKKALAANKAYCSDASLAREREARIRDARKKLAEREKSLAEAERKGDQKKIAARTAKLDEARRELAESEKPVGQ